MARTVLLIHGAWLTPASWDAFRARYEAQGYHCLVPAWPLENRKISELRRAPHWDLVRLTVGKIVQHYATLIGTLPEPPILIGHSLGGLTVQMLLDRGLGAAGVAIDPAPARGIYPRPNALRAALPVLAAWNGWNRMATMTPEQFAWGFAHLSTPEEQRAAFEQYVVPAPGRLYYQLALGIGTGVNFGNPDRAPLLLISGEQDRTIEPSMVLQEYARYQRSGAVTEFRSYPDRTHWIIGMPGWEEIADYAIEWADRNATLHAARRPAAPALPLGAGAAGGSQQQESAPIIQ